MIFKKKNRWNDVMTFGKRRQGGKEMEIFCSLTSGIFLDRKKWNFDYVENRIRFGERIEFVESQPTIGRSGVVSVS